MDHRGLNLLPRGKQSARLLQDTEQLLRDVSLNESAMLSAVITMAHALNLRVVAQGVESEAQLLFLRSERCDAAQGPLFGAPATAAGFEKLLRIRGGDRLEGPASQPRLTRI